MSQRNGPVVQKARGRDEMHQGAGNQHRRNTITTVELGESAKTNTKIANSPVSIHRRNQHCRTDSTMISSPRSPTVELSARCARTSLPASPQFPCDSASTWQSWLENNFNERSRDSIKQEVEGKAMVSAEVKTNIIVRGFFPQKYGIREQPINAGAFLTMILHIDQGRILFHHRSVLPTGGEVSTSYNEHLCDLATWSTYAIRRYL